MVHVDKKNVKQYQKDLLAYFDNVYPEIGKEIEETRYSVMNWEKRSFRLQMSSGIVQLPNKLFVKNAITVK